MSSGRVHALAKTCLGPRIPHFNDVRAQRQVLVELRATARARVRAREGEGEGEGEGVGDDKGEGEGEGGGEGEGPRAVFARSRPPSHLTVRRWVSFMYAMRRANPRALHIDMTAKLTIENTIERVMRGEAR